MSLPETPKGLTRGDVLAAIGDCQVPVSLQHLVVDVLVVEEARACGFNG
jgi:hypothetical protein